MRDDPLGRQFGRIHAGVRIGHEHRAKTEIAGRATRRIDAVLRLHSSNHDLADAGRMQLCGERRAGEAARLRLGEHGIACGIDCEFRQQCGQWRVGRDRRAGGAGVPHREYRCTGFMRAADQPVDVREHTFAVVRPLGAVIQADLHVDDEQGAFRGRDFGHGVSPE